MAVIRNDSFVAFIDSDPFEGDTSDVPSLVIQSFYYFDGRILNGGDSK